MHRKNYYTFGSWTLKYINKGIHIDIDLHVKDYTNQDAYILGNYDDTIKKIETFAVLPQKQS